LNNKIKNYLSNNKSIHILVNNTGGPPGGPIIKAEVVEFENAFERHLVCNHILTQAVVEKMKEENY
jgi:3-oxoacyl-[acyl-carrier protein] reductase